VQGNSGPDEHRPIVDLRRIANGDGEDALRALDTPLEAMSCGGPSMALLKRNESLKAYPPSRDWDGSWHIGEWSRCGYLEVTTATARQ
jgi:hypothetical protein